MTARWKILLANCVKFFCAPVGALEISRRHREAKPPEQAMEDFRVPAGTPDLL